MGGTEEAAAPARMVKMDLQDKLRHCKVYLDSDDLRDLRKLLDAVKARTPPSPGQVARSSGRTASWD